MQGAAEVHKKLEVSLMCSFIRIREIWKSLTDVCFVVFFFCCHGKGTIVLSSMSVHEFSVMRAVGIEQRERSTIRYTSVLSNRCEDISVFELFFAV